MLVPLVNQLNDPNTDGQPDVNARANCNMACASAAVRGLLGRNISSGDIHDAVYGTSYRGATDPARLIPYMATLGLHMWEVQQPAAQLIQTIISQVQQGHPVSAAIPSLWGIVTAAQVAANPSLSTHEIIFCGYDAVAGTLTAMNPWPVSGNAFYQVMPLAWWQSRLVYGPRAFPIERSLPVTLTRVDAQTARDAHGVELHFSMANYALAHHASADILHPQDYSLQSADPAHFNAFALLTDGAVLTYQKQENATREDRGAFVAQALLDRGAAAAQQIATLTQELAAAKAAAKAAASAAPAPATATSPELGAIRAQLQELLHQLPAEPAA